MGTVVDDDKDQVLGWHADSEHVSFYLTVSAAPLGWRSLIGDGSIQPVYAFVRSALGASASSKPFVLCISPHRGCASVG